MCEKGDLWVEGSQPVSQEGASLPIISSLPNVFQQTSEAELARSHWCHYILLWSRGTKKINTYIVFNTKLFLH